MPLLIISDSVLSFNFQIKIKGHCSPEKLYQYENQFCRTANRIISALITPESSTSIGMNRVLQSAIRMASESANFSPPYQGVF
jgi:hypothetical protein